MPQIGDLIFVRGTSLIDKGIDWAENGVYSHVAVYVGSGKVLEAQGGRRIGYNTLDYYAGHYDVGHIYAPDSVRKKVLSYAKSKIGTRYGWKTIILLIFKLVFHIKWKYNSDRGMICSDYSAWCWSKAGLPLTKKINLNTPQDVADSALVHIEKGDA